MKRNLPHVIIYIMSVICLALLICGGVMLTKGRPRPHNHVSRHIYATQPTCETVGNSEYWLCETCGKCFSDELLKEEIPQSDTVIAKLPHVEEVIKGTPATCTTTGLTDGKRCTVCKTVTQKQTEIKALGHTEEVIKGTPATCTTAGLTDGKRCTVCKTVTQKQTEIKALRHNLTYHKETPSTCLEHGNPDYWYCSRCKNIFAEEECQTTLRQDEISYPLADHTYKQCFNATRHYKKATCGHEPEEKDGGNHNFIDNVCTDCGFHDYGVVYALNADGTAYRVTDRTRTAYHDKVEIYAEYDGLPVTEIANGAIDGDYIAGITVPASVTAIGPEAFRRCYDLSEINVAADNPRYESKGNCLIDKDTRTLIVGCQTSVIPADSSVIALGYGAFYGCDNLTGISIPDAVTYIGGSAFYGCSGLQKVILSERITKISNFAFYNCTHLTDITLPASVKTIGAHAFDGCTRLPAINIPDGVTLIDEFTFYDCDSLTSITVPSSVTEIGNRAFCRCSDLAEVIIPENGNMTAFYGGCFEGCASLKKIHIPSSVTSVYASSFEDCPALEKITVGANNQKYRGVNNCVIEKSTGALILGCNKSVIPDDGTVTEISVNAFDSCPLLTSVHIPASVTFISSYAFSGMSSLNEITADAGNEYYYVESGCLIKRSNKTLILGCNTSVIPNDGSVTAIGANAFNGCKAESINMPACVTKIDGTAFRGSDIKNLYIEDFESWLKLNLDPTPSPSNSAHGAAPLQAGGNIYVNGELLTELILPDGITEIYNYAFYHCLSLTKVIIPDGVTAVGYSAFYGCDNITEFDTGNGVTELISVSNFKKLETLVIGNGITEIGTNAFTSCTSLSSVTLGDNITEIGAAFMNCTSLTEIVLPENLQILRAGAFYRCSNLTTVTIYGGVTSIAANAFRNCTSLTDVYYDGTKEQWLEVAKVRWDYGTGDYTIHFNDGTTMKKGDE